MKKYEVGGEVKWSMAGGLKRGGGGFWGIRYWDDLQIANNDTATARGRRNGPSVKPLAETSQMPNSTL